MAEQRHKHEETVGVPAVDAVPGDDKAHAHSHAAHLQPEGTQHVIPGGGAGKQGREPGTLREPPQDPRRSGKGHGRE